MESGHESLEELEHALQEKRDKIKKYTKKRDRIKKRRKTHEKDTKNGTARDGFKQGWFNLEHRSTKDIKYQAGRCSIVTVTVTVMPISKPVPKSTCLSFLKTEQAQVHSLNNRASWLPLSRSS